MRRPVCCCLALLLAAALLCGCGVTGGADGPTEVQVFGVTVMQSP